MCWMYGININILKKIMVDYILVLIYNFNNDFIKIKFEFNNLDCIFFGIFYI